MEVTEYEIGLEMNLFDNLRFEVSYYDKVSDNQILSAQVSDASGFTSQLINVGKSKNQGVELFASYSPLKVVIRMEYFGQCHPQYFRGVEFGR